MEGARVRAFFHFPSSIVHPAGVLQRPVGLLLLALLACPTARTSAQGLSVTTSGEALKIRAPGFTFLEGQPLAHLKDGRSVRVELAVSVLPGPGKAPVTANRRVFAVSYDLWEERFAVATVGRPSESIPHLSAAAAVSWCIDQLAVPLSALGALRGGVPFWIRLEYRILDGDEAAGADGESTFTLQALIDALSRRRRAETSGDALEAGPFRLPTGGGPPPPPT